MHSQSLVNAGMLSEEGRASYQETPAEACPFVDRQRAIDEIALVNNQTGEVTYGIYSLFAVLANSWPGLQPLFGYKPFAWLMSKIYFFISFNRRVIIPPPNTPVFGLQPTFKIHYRLVYIFLLLFASSLIFYYYAKASESNAVASFYCIFLFMFQALLSLTLARKKRWDYLGNLATVSFIGALLLTPFLLFDLLFNPSSLIFLIYGIAVCGFIYYEHLRRIRIINAGWLLNFSYGIGLFLWFFWLLCD